AIGAQVDHEELAEAPPGGEASALPDRGIVHRCVGGARIDADEHGNATRPDMSMEQVSVATALADQRAHAARSSTSTPVMMSSCASTVSRRRFRASLIDRAIVLRSMPAKNVRCSRYVRP